MKNILFSAAIFICLNAYSQNAVFSNEAFVNAVSKIIIDSSVTHYYLFSNAAACSFIKFDYDEWYKYGLKEDVPIYILNELAKQSFNNNKSLQWQQQKLTGAVCIDDKVAKAILAETQKRHVKNGGKSVDDRTVYYFSQPAFTEDQQYAVIDMGFRCDDLQCGMGATFLFRQINGKWKIAGRKIVWGN